SRSAATGGRRPRRGSKKFRRAAHLGRSGDHSSRAGRCNPASRGGTSRPRREGEAPPGPRGSLCAKAGGNKGGARPSRSRGQGAEVPASARGARGFLPREARCHAGRARIQGGGRACAPCVAGPAHLSGVLPLVPEARGGQANPGGDHRERSRVPPCPAPPRRGRFVRAEVRREPQVTRCRLQEEPVGSSGTASSRTSASRQGRDGRGDRGLSEGGEARASVCAGALSVSAGASPDRERPASQGGAERGDNR